MPTLPPTIRGMVAAFAPRCSRRVWAHVQVLLAGALLAPARRTVAAALRAMGLAQTRQFHRSHRALSHATWSGFAVSRVLLRLLVAAFAPEGPLVVGLDETLERRRGHRIAAKGSSRDPVRSSRAHFVKTSGLRWVCVLLLVPLPWAARVWALPFLTALAPSERSDAERGRRPKTLTDWGRHLLLVVRRWWPDRSIVAVADRTSATLGFLAACQTWANPVTIVTRLRLDAARYAPAPPRRPGQRGRPRLKGERLPTLATVAADPVTTWARLRVANWYGAGASEVEVASATAVWSHTGSPPVPLRWVLVRDSRGQFETQALRCTDAQTAPAQLLAWFVQRWQLEVTFEEVRRHLGVETQRQWSDLAIRRTTPALLGLFSVVTLLAHHQQRVTGPVGAIAQAAWYPKAAPPSPTPSPPSGASCGIIRLSLRPLPPTRW